MRWFVSGDNCKRTTSTQPRSKAPDRNALAALGARLSPSSLRPPTAGPRQDPQGPRGKRALSQHRALWLALAIAGVGVLAASASPSKGVASWYGEQHRGKLMANGKKFDPDKLTAASWFYPLGTRVRVTAESPVQPRRSVLVTITDRGPAPELVRCGRIIDLSEATFRKLAHPNLGLVGVAIEAVR